MKISIVTINYNNIKGLKETVKSVINQTYSDIEYIIIDGGSKDGSAEYIEEMSSHFNYWISEPDNGIYNAINKGIEKATGEYLQFLNSGDWLVDKFVIERMFNDLPKCDLIFGNCRMMMPNGKIRIDRPLETKINFRTFFKGTINHQSAFISQQLFKNYGLYDESLKIVSDWKFFLKAVGLNRSNTIYKNIDIVYYDREGFSSVNRDLLVSERKMVMDEMIPITIQDHFNKFDQEYIRLSIINKHKLTSMMYRFAQIFIIRLSRLLDRL